MICYFDATNLTSEINQSAIASKLSKNFISLSQDPFLIGVANVRVFIVSAKFFLPFRRNIFCFTI